MKIHINNNTISNRHVIRCIIYFHLQSNCKSASESISRLTCLEHISLISTLSQVSKECRRLLLPIREKMQDRIPYFGHYFCDFDKFIEKGTLTLSILHLSPNQRKNAIHRITNAIMVTPYIPKNHIYFIAQPLIKDVKMLKAAFYSLHREDMKYFDKSFTDIMKGTAFLNISYTFIALIVSYLILLMLGAQKEVAFKNVLLFSWMSGLALHFYFHDICKKLRNAFSTYNARINIEACLTRANHFIEDRIQGIQPGYQPSEDPSFSPGSRFSKRMFTLQSLMIKQLYPKNKETQDIQDNLLQLVRLHQLLSDHINGERDSQHELICCYLNLLTQAEKPRQHGQIPIKKLPFFMALTSPCLESSASTPFHYSLEEETASGLVLSDSARHIGDLLRSLSLFEEALSEISPVTAPSYHETANNTLTEPLLSLDLETGLAAT